MSLTIAVAMSGGVDSAVTAMLLKKEGYQVIGVTFNQQQPFCAGDGAGDSDATPPAQTALSGSRSRGERESEVEVAAGWSVEAGERENAGENDKAGEWKDPAGSTSNITSDSISRARSIAGYLGIPHYVLPVYREFEEFVLKQAWAEYARGRTPNPCAICNERIKFGYVLAWARQMGAGKLATGHYARVTYEEDGFPVLRRGVDRRKDQSYFLAGLSSDQLKAVLFPLGNFTKDQVRLLARKNGLPFADTSESQDACLIQEGQSLAETLRHRFGADAKTGSVVDENGTLLGRHSGIHQFTIGQRRGIPVDSPRRLWVKSIQGDTGTVVVTTSEDTLLCRRLIASGCTWLLREAPESRRCEVQVRYKHQAAPALVERLPNGNYDEVIITFDAPVRAPTPGQAAVFYDGERVLGRGWIEEAW